MTVYFKGKQKDENTYLSSAVWAAMRVRSDLSARGQPDRLEDMEKKSRLKRKERGELRREKSRRRRQRDFTERPAFF